jgi:hypothetical protein
VQGSKKKTRKKGMNSQAMAPTPSEKVKVENEVMVEKMRWNRYEAGDG